MTLTQVQNLLRQTLSGVEMESSARLCLKDSISLFDDRDDYVSAYRRGVNGLAYSIGTFDKRYQSAKKTLDGLESKVV